MHQDPAPGASLAMGASRSSMPLLESETSSSCSACGSGDIRVFYRIKDVPAHSCLMLSTQAQARAFPRGEIELGFCRGCGFIGNLRFDPGLNRYSPDYEE